MFASSLGVKNVFGVKAMCLQTPLLCFVPKFVRFLHKLSSQVGLKFSWEDSLQCKASASYSVLGFRNQPLMLSGEKHGRIGTQKSANHVRLSFSLLTSSAPTQDARQGQKGINKTTNKEKNKNNKTIEYNN